MRMSEARQYTDFHEVRPQHAEIHKELQNWARWALQPWGAKAQHPMFRWSKPAQHWSAVDVPEVTDPIAAFKIEKAVCKLSTKHQAAIRWSYVFQGPPRRTANKLGLTLDGLADMVHDGRTKLKNATMR